MIHVIDYGRGNLFSIGQALRHLGVPFELTSDAGQIREASRLLLPGVGAFGDAMAGLMARGLADAVKDAANRDIPLLGICVGAQMLLSRSEEFGRHDGLDLIGGTVRRLPEPTEGATGQTRIPNVGWRALETKQEDPVLGSLPANSMAYFVHSLAPMVDDEQHVVATITINGARIPAAIRKGNILGYQFHPEKSGPTGLGLLQRFVEMKV